MEKYVIPNLRNACLILKWLTDHPEGASIPTLSKALTIPRTTVLRIIKTLQLENFLRVRENRYLLGPRLISIGLAARSSIELRPLVVPYLAELSEATDETAHVAIPCEGKSLILEVCDCPHPLRAASRAGTMTELHCSSTGKIFLSYLHHDKLEEYYHNRTIAGRTPNTMTTVEQIRQDVARVRARGYSTDHEEFFIGVRCLAAPIQDSSGQVVAAIGITAATSRFTLDKEPEIARKVIDAARKISRALGHQ